MLQSRSVRGLPREQAGRMATGAGPWVLHTWAIVWALPLPAGPPRVCCLAVHPWSLGSSSVEGGSCSTLGCTAVFRETLVGMPTPDKESPLRS